MLDASAELFRAQGYHATGLTQIMEAGRRRMRPARSPS
jgi:hypothetical protein